jgi:histidyl-tRNA synthetase
MELDLGDKQAKGTRILTGETFKQRRKLIQDMIIIAEEYGFEGILLPSVEKAQIYTDKAGPEILGQMYAFLDKGDRELCLRPEGTATVQLLADKYWKQQEKKLWYEERCWRYERNQMGRWREFTQFGMEWINPKDKNAEEKLIEIAERMVKQFVQVYEINRSVKRGLSYYTGSGFEIVAPCLGAQRQIDRKSVV